MVGALRAVADRRAPPRQPADGAARVAVRPLGGLAVPAPGRGPRRGPGPRAASSAEQLDDLRAIGLDWDGDRRPPVRSDAALRGGARSGSSERAASTAASAPAARSARRPPPSTARRPRASIPGPAASCPPRESRTAGRGRRAVRPAAARRARRGDDRRPPPRRAHRPGRRPRPAPPRRRLRLQPRGRRRRCRPGRRGGRPRRRPAPRRPPARRCSATCSGCARPAWAHVPLVLGPDGERLAKRHGAVTLADLARGGRSAADAVAWMAASLDLAPPGEPVTPADLLPLRPGRAAAHPDDLHGRLIDHRPVARFPVHDLEIRAICPMFCRAGHPAPKLVARADVAQLVEHFTRNEGVSGSNPLVGFKKPRKSGRSRSSSVETTVLLTVEETMDALRQAEQVQ